MNIVLLSGGSGKRLWPLSNDIRSKQFIQIFQDENGEYHSMVQRVYKQIKKADPEAAVTIATSKSITSWGKRWGFLWSRVEGILSRPLSWRPLISMM